MIGIYCIKVSWCNQLVVVMGVMSVMDQFNTNNYYFDYYCGY